MLSQMTNGRPFKETLNKSLPNGFILDKDPTTEQTLHLQQTLSFHVIKTRTVFLINHTSSSSLLLPSFPNPRFRSVCPRFGNYHLRHKQANKETKSKQYLGSQPISLDLTENYTK